MRPKAPYGMEFARIAVPDLAATVAFYEYHVGLQVEYQTDHEALLRADVEHHCLHLVSDPRLEDADTLAVGFSVESDEVLTDLQRRLDGAGHDVLPLADHMKSLVDGGFAVRDPNGMLIELFTEFQQYAEPPLLELRPIDLVHPFISTDKYEESLAFYVGVLGFQVSDYFGDQTAFARSENRLHHSFAIRRDDRFYVAHLCFMMKSLDHVMRGRARAIYKQVPIASDIVNHSGSRSIAFYMLDPKHGPRVELCDGHIRLTEEEHETRRPRRMAVDPRNIDVWRPAPDDWGRF